ncbi:PH-like domain-containing protein [Leucobacter salsicius]|uniref:PH-like domain-containing protein n=1 Tax=Leucobacter salsicius TaxID=664638 RepID=UPI000347001B|nr:hypothetical protein [Leucobacter salsicius]
MSRTGFAILMVGIAVAILALMWLGWRGRARRDSGIVLAAQVLAGAALAEFTGVQYVSTTPLGRPLERVAIPGLRYKGLAALSVRTDGVEIAVTGETPVTIPAAALLGTSRASGRVGKAVESGGLAVLEWQSTEGQAFESGFRFAAPSQQAEFEAAVAQLTT